MDTVLSYELGKFLRERELYENNGNFFKFTWKIENIRFLLKKNGEFIQSPCFTIKKFLNTTWYLRLFPRGENDSTTKEAACFLYLSASETKFDGIEIGYEMMSLSKLFLLQDFQKDEERFLCKVSGTGNGYSSLPHIPSISPESGHNPLFLENDVYIVCYMWMSDDQVNKNSVNESKIFMELLRKKHLSNPVILDFSKKMCPSFTADIRAMQEKICLSPNQCFARSVVQVEPKKFFWTVEYFNGGEIFKQFILTKTSEAIPDVMIVLSNKECKTGDIKVTIYAINTDSSIPILAICKISVADSSKNIQHSTESKHCFSATNTDVWSFEISCNCATMKKDLNLFTRCFSHIYCDITTSTGAVSSWIEEVSYENSAIDVFKDSHMSPSKLEILDLYTKQRFTDVTFQLGDKTLQAHKAILCARSPVFSAMFENDMEENKTNVISIEDIDADILERMLKFMYCDSIKDMQYEVALKLYETADKYQVIILREKCAQLILSNLTVNNVCSALCLGDAHHDEKLKNSILNFVLEHWNEILISKEWKLLFKQNVQIAAETLQEVCLKLSKIQL